MDSSQKFRGFAELKSHDITQALREARMPKTDRLPKKGGASEAMRRLKEMRRKEPSNN
jgi:hypothetical protein